MINKRNRNVASFREITPKDWQKQCLSVWFEERSHRRNFTCRKCIGFCASELKRGGKK